VNGGLSAVFTVFVNCWRCGDERQVTVGVGLLGFLNVEQSFWVWNCLTECRSRPGVVVGLLEFGLGCWNFGLLEFWNFFGLLEFLGCWNFFCLVALFGCCEKLIWMGVGYFWWEVVIKK
jgi:hypothetical protein